MTRLLVFTALAVLFAPEAAVAQSAPPGPAEWRSLPPDPVQVRLVEPDSLEQIMPDSLVAGGVTLRPSDGVYARVRTDARGPHVQLYTTYSQARRYGASGDGAEVFIYVHAQPAPLDVPDGGLAPEAEETVQVSGRVATLAREYRSLYVPVGTGRYVSLTATASVSVDDLIAIAEAIDLDAFAALPDDLTVLRRPDTPWYAFESLNEYWEATPALVDTRQASLGVLANAMPEARGLKRTFQRIDLKDTAFRDQTADGERVGVPPGIVLPVVGLEACYTKTPAQSPVEAAAIALAEISVGDPYAVSEPPVACLTLRALPPDERAVDGLLRETVESYREAYNAEQARYAEQYEREAPPPLDVDAEVARLRARALSLDSRDTGARGRLGTLSGFRATSSDSYGRATTQWTFRLDSLRLLAVSHPAGRETEAAALVQALDLRALRADRGEPIVYAVRPKRDRSYYYEGDRIPDPVFTFGRAENYEHTLAYGIVGREDGLVVMQSLGSRTGIPVPDGWALWDGVTTLAASPEAAVSPGQVHTAYGVGETVLFVGRAESVLSLWRRTRAEPASAYDRPQAYLFGGAAVPLDGSDGGEVDLPRVIDVPGALAAVTYGVTAERYVLRVVHIEHATLGPYAVAVVSPPTEASGAEALALRTARGLRLLRDAPTVPSRY